MSECKNIYSDTENKYERIYIMFFSESKVNNNDEFQNSLIMKINNVPVKSKFCNLKYT